MTCPRSSPVCPRLPIAAKPRRVDAVSRVGVATQRIHVHASTEDLSQGRKVLARIHKIA